MNVLIADKLSETAIEALNALGVQVNNQPQLTADDLPHHLKGVEVLIVRSTKVKAEAIQAADNLDLIVRAGAGVNTIDLQTASEQGIYVANCPGKNKDAVVELTIGLLVAADRKIVDASQDLRQGQWKKKLYGKADGLRGKTLGIIGMGAIGRSVAEVASAMGMHVIGWSRSLTPEKAEAWGVGYCETIAQLAAQADAISIHVAMTPETQHMVNEEFLQHLKPGTILINTSRGGIHDTAALKKAIHEKGLKVALDVYESEPAAGDPTFADVEFANMITGTPHIGASTKQASEAIALEAVRIVQTFLETGRPANALNVREKTAAQANLIIRHYNRVGVLASILDFLRESGINVEEMDNTIFAGDKAAVCSLKLDQAPTEPVLQQIRNHDQVMNLLQS